MLVRFLSGRNGRESVLSVGISHLTIMDVGMERGFRGLWNSGRPLYFNEA